MGPCEIKKDSIILHFAHLSVSLAASKILSFGNEKKNLFSFCISLTYLYLCKIIYFE